MRDPYTNTQNVLRHAQNPCVAMQRIAIAFPSPLLSLKATFATATFPQSRRPTTTTTHTDGNGTSTWVPFKTQQK